jgi:hypothetical protein
MAIGIRHTDTSQPEQVALFSESKLRGETIGNVGGRRTEKATTRVVSAQSISALTMQLLRRKILKLLCLCLGIGRFVLGVRDSVISFHWITYSTCFGPSSFLRIQRGIISNIPITLPSPGVTCIPLVFPIVGYTTTGTDCTQYTKNENIMMMVST